MAQVFPSFIDEDDNTILMASVSKGEVEGVLLSMQKEKSLGPDGWMVEFFQHFFDLIGDDHARLVEDSKSKGFVHDPLNSTFPDLIPKSGDPQSFNDFRPISLCNCTYKISTKTIAR